MTFEEAISFFGDQGLLPQLKLMIKVGLGYLELGQALEHPFRRRIPSAGTGYGTDEALKGKTLYLFEEPSTGLHSVI